MKPLDSIVILDITHILSGPYASMLLADMGARVIKIEPLEGEMTRQLLANDPKNSIKGMGAYSLTLNRNKESICINLKTEEGRELFYGLVRKADIVMNNLAPGGPKKLKIDHEVLSKINPRIITCSITGFGETGPYPNRPAFDQVVQSMGGGMSITGFPDGPPTRASIPIGDLGGGVFGVIGILAALQARHVTGRGQHVDISMLDVQISLLTYMATMFFLSGENHKALGNAHFVHVPYNTYPTKDRWITVALVSNETWPGVVAAFGIEELKNPAFATRAGRWDNKELIDGKIREKLLTKTCDEWLEILERHHVPCAPVNDFNHALNDPQVRARNMVVKVEHPEGGAIEQPGNPIKMSDTSEDSYAPPPLAGQDTAKILHEFLGKTESDLARLCDARVIK